jgi:hypothetical protein
VATSPGGLYRTPLGRLIFKTDEMIQVVEAPDVVRNKVSFSVFGLDGAVSLKGKLTVFFGQNHSVLILCTVRQFLACKCTISFSHVFSMLIMQVS